MNLSRRRWLLPARKNRQVLARVQSLLAGIDLSKKDGSKLAAGDLVVARFTADDTPYRARVMKVDGNKIAVYYIDFGNVCNLFFIPPLIIGGQCGFWLLNLSPKDVSNKKAGQSIRDGKHFKGH